MNFAFLYHADLRSFVEYLLGQGQSFKVVFKNPLEGDDNLPLEYVEVQVFGIPADDIDGVATCHNGYRLS